MVQPAIALETVLADPDDDVVPLEAANQERTVKGKPRVGRRRDARLDSARFVQCLLQKVFRRPDAEVSVIGKTPHNDLRLAVEALSGGPPLTIYAERL